MKGDEIPIRQPEIKAVKKIIEAARGRRAAKADKRHPINKIDIAAINMARFRKNFLDQLYLWLLQDLFSSQA